MGERAFSQVDCDYYKRCAAVWQRHAARIQKEVVSIPIS